MPVVVDFFVAELAKLAKRPASWILALILMLNLILFGYVFLYVYLASLQASGASAATVEPIMARVLPGNALSGTVANLSGGLGGALALIFGVLLSGGEYGWGTLKLMLTQRPGRLGMMLGKVFAVAAALVGFALAVLLMCLLCSFLVSVLQSAPAEWPSLGATLKGLGVGWLVMFTWASLGIFLGILFRDTALAVGVGLVYITVVERLALRLLVPGEAFERFQGLLLSDNAATLAGSLQQGTQEGGASGGPLQSAAIMVVYAAAFIVGAVVLFRRRDV